MQDSQSSPGAGLITATIEAATGKIVEVRSTDDAGASHELTADLRAALAQQSGDATLQELFEQAFEAGIASVLGDDVEDAEASEPEEDAAEDAALRRQLLRPMIENSAARSLMRQEVLGRAIVGTLIQKAAASGAAAAAPFRTPPAS